MTTHVFYPPAELPTQVQAYVQGLKNHKSDYGDVALNSPSDLREIDALARKLEPMAQEIHDLQLTLAAKLEKYHQAAAPLWTAFSDKLGHAKLDAEKHHKEALLVFLRNYQHHTTHAAAAKAAAAAPAAPPAPTK